MQIFYFFFGASQPRQQWKLPSLISLLTLVVFSWNPVYMLSWRLLWFSADFVLLKSSLTGAREREQSDRDQIKSESFTKEKFHGPVVDRKRTWWLLIVSIITSWSSVWLSWRRIGSTRDLYLESCDELLWKGAKQPTRRWLKYSGESNLCGDLFLEAIFPSCFLLSVRFVVGRPFAETVRIWLALSMSFKISTKTS